MSIPLDVERNYILGLDLGSASIGWAVIDLDTAYNPCALRAAGSHIFDAGVQLSPAASKKKLTLEDATLQGVDRSKAVERRTGRSQRRVIERKAKRAKELFKLLRDAKLLPDYADLVGKPSAAQRHHTLERLDKELLEPPFREEREKHVMREADQALPYVLRKEALERELQPYELGRVLYQLCQRRGYEKSPMDDSSQDEAAPDQTAATEKRSKKKAKESEDEGDEKSSKKVEAGIADLKAKMIAADAKTMGVYFANFKNNDPHLSRIRHRWTGRDMFKDEFRRICEEQSKYYPGLLEGSEFRKEVYRCLFFQRKLKSAEHLIGRCDLEPAERRAPWWSLEAQRFRLLQFVNDLAIVPDDPRKSPERLSPERRRILAAELEEKESFTLTEAKKLLGFEKGTQFNFKRKTDRIAGNRVANVMLEVFGDRWKAENPAGTSPYSQWQLDMVKRWAETQGPEERWRVASEELELKGDAAEKWVGSRPPADYCKHSLKALRRLLVDMELGVPYATARAKFPGRLAGKKPLDFVPKVHETLPSITNPAVLRALTELRKVVNAIIREQRKKPYEIRIELARELRKNRKQRQLATQAGERNEERRFKAAEKILKECRNYDPQGRDAKQLVKERRNDVTKMMLLDECRCICPYTGRPIGYLDLFSGEVEVEHIIPQSLLLDNSFNNLTLCYRSENLKKLNRTPRQAYCPSEDDENWIKILQRVKDFGNKEKLHRFTLRDEEIGGFTRRHMNDTRYTSKLAGRLLMSLYGGRATPAADAVDELDEFNDAGNRRRISVSSGMITSLLRDAWSLHLDKVLGKEMPVVHEETKAKAGKVGAKKMGKDRSDHRHHALDAVVIALTTDSVIQEANKLAGILYEKYKRPLIYRDLRSIKAPWANFVDDRFREVFRDMLTSRRPEHKLSGALHDATLYAKWQDLPNKEGEKVRHKRVSVGTGLSPANIEKIVDPCVKKIVKEFGEKIGGFSKWKEEKDWPRLPHKRLGTVPIKKVRIESTKKATPLTSKQSKDAFGKGYPERNVEEGEIAYVNFFMVQGKKGTKWVWDIVKLFKARQRLLALPKEERGNVNNFRRHPDYPDATFRFGLMKGDVVELRHEGPNKLFVVKMFESDGRLKVAPINAAGKLDESGVVLRIGFTDFLQMGLGELKEPRPVFVDLLGKKHYIKTYA
jgi:CRISPR-associated endonuclease Csn1